MWVVAVAVKVILNLYLKMLKIKRDNREERREKGFIKKREN